MCVSECVRVCIHKRACDEHLRVCVVAHMASFVCSKRACIRTAECEVLFKSRTPNIPRHCHNKDAPFHGDYTHCIRY